MLKKTLVVCMGLCVWLCASMTVWGQETPAKSKLEWAKFTSEEGGFSVSFPGKPMVKTETKSVIGVEVALHRHILAISNQYYFEVSFSEVPRGFPAYKSLDGTLNGISRFFQSKAGKEISRTTVNNGTCDGREGTFVSLASPLTKVRVWGTGFRVYTLIFSNMGPDQESEKIALQFLNSFEISGGCSKEVEQPEVTLKPTSKRIVEGTRDPKTGWQLIKVEPDRFSVLMPGDTTAEETEFNLGTFKLKARTYSADSDSNSCMVMSIAGLGTPASENPTQVMLLNLLEGVERTFIEKIETTQVTVKMTKQFQLGRNPGREYDLIRKNGIGKLRLIATPEACFVLINNPLKQDEVGNTVDPFFSSFQLTSK